MYDEGRNILETSGAVAIAGAAAYCEFYKIKNENIVAIASGANMDFSKLHKVTELAGLGSGKEALLATFMVEQQGSFKTFVGLVSYLLRLFKNIVSLYIATNQEFSLSEWGYIEIYLNSLKISFDIEEFRIFIKGVV